MEATSESPIGEPVTFERPPVGEVALAVQLAEPATDDASTLGRFWPRIQVNYPRVQAQPALPPMSEVFGAPAPPTVSFQLLDQAPSQRYWFLSDDETEIVQVQPDRIAFNWRKDPVGGGAGGEYPRYLYLRGRFENVLKTFFDAMRETERDPLPTWCEVTYINAIATTSGERPDLSSVLRRIAALPTDLLPQPEDTSFAERFVLRRDGEPFGRFYISAQSAVRQLDQQPVYMVTLTARGMASPQNVEGVLAFTDYGRDLIVRAFRDITTGEMHEEWGLQ